MKSYRDEMELKSERPKSHWRFRILLSILVILLITLVGGTAFSKWRERGQADRSGFDQELAHVIEVMNVDAYISLKVAEHFMDKSRPSDFDVEGFAKLIDTLRKSKAKVRARLDQLQFYPAMNPGLNHQVATVYSSYVSLIDSAISPGRSMNVYADNVSEAFDAFNRDMSKLKAHRL